MSRSETLFEVRDSGSIRSRLARPDWTRLYADLVGAVSTLSQCRCRFLRTSGMGSHTVHRRRHGTTDLQRRAFDQSIFPQVLRQVGVVRRLALAHNGLHLQVQVQVWCGWGQGDVDRCGCEGRRGRGFAARKVGCGDVILGAQNLLALH